MFKEYKRHSEIVVFNLIYSPCIHEHIKIMSSGMWNCLCMKRSIASLAKDIGVMQINSLGFLCLMKTV